jgi:hypothetical protein
MSINSIAALFAAVAAGGLVSFGCDSNMSGVIRARTLGDTSHVLQVRTSSVTLPSACDVTEADDPGLLRRSPYLQQLTTDGVRVVWTSDGHPVDGGAGEAVVIVTGEDGAAVTSVPALRDPSAHPPGGAVQWSAAITGLTPDTPYCYQVWVGDTTAAQAGFRTAPAAGSGHAVHFVAFGDSGNGGADQQAVAAQLQTVPFDFIVHLGDIAYEGGTRAQLESSFFGIYADLLEDFAVFPASGNHEYVTEDAAPFREAFVLPENGAPAGVERWYSYDWGDVHLVVLDSERVSAVQADWLDTDLTANKLPWVIVYFHRPPFSSGEHGGDPNVQRYFVPLFVAHHVPLVLSGHDHDYERTSPQDGVTYVVSGGGGRGVRAVGRSSFTAFSEGVCHFVFVSIEGDTLTLHAIDGVGQEFDSLVLSRPVGR